MSNVNQIIFRPRFLLPILFILILLLLPGCTSLLLDQYHPYIRSDTINTDEQHAAVIAKARLGWTDDYRVRVLYLEGTPYERGYQHGALLKAGVRDNLLALYNGALDKYPLEEMFFEAYERQRPFIPQEYVDEMRGLAHGSELPLSVVHAIHALPEIGEWGGRRQMKDTAMKLLRGEIGHSCSNFSGFNLDSEEHPFLSVRILDWGLHRISKLHQYPLIIISKNEGGVENANISWVGFIGAVSGINAAGITLGEMGYGDPQGETLAGKPMPFLLRDILNYATSLEDVRKLIKESAPTNSFVYLMTDGKTRDSELYIRDPSRFLVFRPGEDIADTRKSFPGIERTVYGGHFQDRMLAMMQEHGDKFTPEIIMKEIIPHVAMKSNFQNVIYDPVNLQFWVSNARSKDEPAFEQPYTHFDFKAALHQNHLEP